jgi:hypothetical protein
MERTPQQNAARKYAELTTPENNDTEPETEGVRTIRVEGNGRPLAIEAIIPGMRPRGIRKTEILEPAGLEALHSLPAPPRNDRPSPPLRRQPNPSQRQPRPNSHHPQNFRRPFLGQF